MHRRLILSSLALLPALAMPALAGGIFTDSGIALRGYDPVAYFTDGAPRRGDAAHAQQWQGVEWHFVSAANRDAFASDPDRYAPQYGGYCAWAVAQGYLAPIDPTAWRIVDDKLYLNFNARIQRRWERDIPGFIAAARDNWPALQSN